MNKKNKKDDFFYLMQHFEFDKMNRTNLKFLVLICVFILPVIILVIIFSSNEKMITNMAIGILLAFYSLTILLCIFQLTYFILRNSAEFISGKLSSGIVNFIISIIFVFIVLFIIDKVLPKENHSYITAIIAAAATLYTAILALMGIHYSTVKKQEERMYKNKLVFEKDKATDKTIAYVLRRDIDCNSIDVCIKNISANFGYLCGIYRICGCDIYAIEEKLQYAPIAPKKSYIIKNISYKTGDDQLILIYKDIEDKHYYMHLRILSNHNFEIMGIDLCNMSFISERLKLTKRMEEKLKSNKIISTKSEIELEERISINKENTKPIRTKHVNGYEIIVDEGGEDLTDMALLEKLKKERLTLSRENRVKAYIIFNNQQLVAMATYKPIDYESFISIYGLGEGKYNLYGEQFIEIIKNHIS